MAARRGGRRRSGIRWTSVSDEELLDRRICDLPLRIEGSALEPRVERLGEELSRAGLRFRPYLWLSTDWFTPHGVSGFAIPFFLAHPRLVRLERNQMLEVEGGTRDACMKLLRHEAGHALDNAYRLRRRRPWREVFGTATAPYRATYVPRPYSRRHVLNLDNWYAQSHPLEDFAETFAVWLRPGSRWRTRYRGWPALRKLLYVDELMREIAQRVAPVRTREKTDSLPQIHMTLREYYRRKKAHYGVEDRSIYDQVLRRLFSDDGAHRRHRLAAAFLRERRVALRRRVSSWTGQYQFVVDQVLGDMIVRSRDLRLRLRHSERETEEDAAVVVTVQTMRFVRRRHRVYFR